MSDKPAAFQGTFADFKLVKTRKVAQFVIEVALEFATDALDAIGGLPVSDKERWVAIALLNMNPAPEKPKQDPKAVYAAKSEGEQAVARAGIMSRETPFQEWVQALSPEEWRAWEGHGLKPDQIARTYIRSECGVGSCSDLGRNIDALSRFLSMEQRYREYQRHG